jgi:hypothetical protein
MIVGSPPLQMGVLFCIIITRFPLIVPWQASGEEVVRIKFSELWLGLADDPCREGKRLARHIHN